MYRAPELARIFSSVRQAVIGLDTETNRIIFANPAAKVALGFDPAGRSAQELLVCDILSEDATEYLCGTTVLDRSASISVVREQTVTLLFIDFLINDKPALNITRNMISSLRNNIMGLKMSADHCFSPVEDGRLPDEKNISIFYHYYYTILRTLIHIDSADQLGRGELLFSPVPVDLVNLCTELTNTVKDLCNNTGVKISFKTEETELIAVVDPAKIEQLLLNLFANSLGHTGKDNSIVLSLARTGSRIIISLDDDGDGIPQETMADLFKLPMDDDSSALNRTGSGLGMYISFGIAQLHKGVLLVESREGIGTCVRFMLPANSEPAPKFSSPEMLYNRDEASAALTTLAEVLTSSSYGLKFED